MKRNRPIFVEAMLAATVLISLVLLLVGFFFTVRSVVTSGTTPETLGWASLGIFGFWLFIACSLRLGRIGQRRDTSRRAEVTHREHP